MAVQQPLTHTTIDSDTLVARLQSGQDHEAWTLVVGRYGPAVRGFARRLGLDAQLAEDVQQDAMLAFAKSVRDGRFDRQRGRLRDFLFAIARNKIRDVRTKEARSPAQVSGRDGAGDFFDDLPAVDHWERLWDAEWQLAVRTECLREARDRFGAETYAAFYFKAIEGRSSEGVAAELGKTVNAVDLATRRVRQFLQRIRPIIEEIF